MGHTGAHGAPMLAARRSHSQRQPPPPCALSLQSSPWALHASPSRRPSVDSIGRAVASLHGGSWPPLAADVEAAGPHMHTACAAAWIYKLAPPPHWPASTEGCHSYPAAGGQVGPLPFPYTTTDCHHYSTRTAYIPPAPLHTRCTHARRRPPPSDAPTLACDRDLDATTPCSGLACHGALAPTMCTPL